MLLETERIFLRALEPEDLDVLYQWENDSELWKYGATLTPYSRFSLREYLENSLQQSIVQSGQLRLMIIHKESNQTIGTVDLYDYNPIHLRAGIGILIDQGFRNKGYGEEALALIQEYAFRVLFLQQLYAHIPATNKNSLNLFSKSGYEQAGILRSWLKTESGFADVCLMQLINFNH